MQRQVILDTETTGLDPTQGHRIIEIGCLEMVNRRLTGEKFHTYLNPEREIDPGAQAVSGISLEFLLDKPKFKEKVAGFLEFVSGAELIIHNAPFDMGFLNSELSLLDPSGRSLESIVNVFDTLTLARQLHPGQKNNLDALCKRYGIDNTNRVYHGALLDAEILAKVYLAMTAGQTVMAFGEEHQRMTIVNGSNRKAKIPSIVRNTASNLPIIYATEFEVSLHETRIKALRKEALTEN